MYSAVDLIVSVFTKSLQGNFGQIVYLYDFYTLVTMSSDVSPRCLTLPLDSLYLNWHHLSSRYARRNEALSSIDYP